MGQETDGQSKAGAGCLIKGLVGLVAMPIAYRASWPIAFVLVFFLRGDTWDSALYDQYREFIWGSGFEIPTAIQLVALVMGCALVSVGLLLWRRYENSRRATK